MFLPISPNCPDRYSCLALFIESMNPPFGWSVSERQSRETAEYGTETFVMVKN